MDAHVHKDTHTHTHTHTQQNMQKSSFRFTLNPNIIKDFHLVPCAGNIHDHDPQK